MNYVEQTLAMIDPDHKSTHVKVEDKEIQFTTVSKNHCIMVRIRIFGNDVIGMVGGNNPYLRMFVAVDGHLIMNHAIRETKSYTLINDLVEAIRYRGALDSQRSTAKLWKELYND
jgi:hypothetical protein